MSCNDSCGPLVVTLLSGAPGLAGPPGPQGPQGPPGSLTSVHGDLSLTADETGALATVEGLRGKPISATAPTNNQALVWNGSAWVATTLTAGTY